METEIRRTQPHPVVVIFVTLLAVWISFQLIGPMLGFLFAVPFYDGTFLELTEAVANPIGDPGMKVPIYIMQGMGTLVGLIVVPLVLLRVFSMTPVKLFATDFGWQPSFIILLVVIVFMGFNSFIVEWNQGIQLPESLAGIEKMLRGLEDQLGELTKYLTVFDSTVQLVLAVVVIAILPAVGEELVFRGIIQREFFRGTGNIHLSIWISAAIFSAIHLQFYGFVPRLLLGALFGYVYYWSGNLWMPILAHFVNNGFTVIAMYLHQQGTIDVDVETTESAPLPAVIGSLVFTIILLYLFKTYYNKKAISSGAYADEVNKSL